MKRIVKAVAALCILCMVAVFAVSCSKPDDSTSKGTDTSDVGTPQKTLVMGTNASFPPFEFKDNTGAGTNGVNGVDAALMKAVADELNMKLEIKDMEFESLSNAIANGQIDCIAAGFTVKPDREETMDFTQGYYKASQSVIVKKGSSIKTKNDLKGKRLGAQSATTGYDEAGKITSKDKVKGFSNGALAVEALKNGQLDAVIIDSNPAREYTKNNSDYVQVIENLFGEEEYAIAVKKGNSELLNQINSALDKIKASGKMDEIIAEYVK